MGYMYFISVAVASCYSNGSDSLHQIVQSYLPFDACIYPHVVHNLFGPCKSASSKYPNGILLGSAIFVGLVVVTNTQMDSTCSSSHLALVWAIWANNWAKTIFFHSLE